jgi:hypothetical protein
MLGRVREPLRRRRRRAAVGCVVLFLGASLAAAHSSVADHHMSEAAGMCLAVLAAGTVAVAAGPGLGRLLPERPRPVRSVGPPLPLVASPAGPSRARGDPSLLQVFRR